MTARSRALRWGPLPKHPLQITMRTPKGPAFKFELLPLHSPLLRQSLLVSFPPLIDMLKFSGYPYLIRGQPQSWGVLAGGHRTLEREMYYAEGQAAPPLSLGPATAGGAQHQAGLE